MFYSVFVLGKKGPLARIWLAAHWDKKITKAQVLETDIVESVDSILQPKVKLSLRTSSHLLLGIVRIYARKTSYLLQDCQDAAFKIKSMFRTIAVDLPDGRGEAPVDAITLPEMIEMVNNFDPFDNPIIHVEPLPCVANLRNITIDDLSSLCDDEDPLLMHGLRDWTDIGSIGQGSINLKENDDLLSDDSGVEGMRKENNNRTIDKLFVDDGFGPVGASAFDVSDVFRPPVNQSINNTHNKMQNESLQVNANSPTPSRPHSRVSDGLSIVPPTPGTPRHIHDDTADNFNVELNNDVQPMIIDDQPTDQVVAFSQSSLVLQPIDSQLGALLERRRKRKQKLVTMMDNATSLSGQQVKAQLTNVSDIVTNLDLAPPTKRLMMWKKNGASDKLFTLPERAISSKILVNYFKRNLATKSIELNTENESSPEEEVVPNEEPNDISVLNEVELDHSQSEMNLPGPLSPVAQAQKPANRKKRKADKENQEGKKRPRLSQIETGRHNVSSIDESQVLQNISLNQSINASFRTSEANDFDGEQQNSLLLNDKFGENVVTEQDDNVNNISSIQANRAASLDHSLSMIDNFGAQSFNESSIAIDKDQNLSQKLPSETDAQYEERLRTKHSIAFLKKMEPKLEKKKPLHFSDLVRKNNRKEAARNFYSLLVLKKQQAVELQQDLEQPYSEIFISKGPKYEDHTASSMIL